MHVGGSFNTTRAAWPHMVEQGYGRIVMTTSSGMFGLPNNLAYATAKAAVIGLTRSLATAGARARHQGQPHRAGGVARAWPGAADDELADGDADGARPVAPMVAFLAHEDCPVSGEIYAAGAGRFARIFIASDRGLRRRDRRADRRGRRRSTGRRSTTSRGYTVPADLMAWSAAFMAHLRLTLSSGYETVEDGCGRGARA